MTRRKWAAAPTRAALALAAIAGACTADIGAPAGPRGELEPRQVNLPTDADTASLILRNVGGRVLEWQAVIGVEWMTAVPAAGTVVPGGSELIVLTIDRPSAPPGTTLVTVEIRTNHVWGRLEAPVSVHVTPVPRLWFAGPAPLRFPATSTGVSIVNTGYAPLEWTAESDVDWIELRDSSGTLAAGGGDTIWFRVDRRRLPSDSSGTILLTTNAAPDPIAIPVQVDGNPPPLILPVPVLDAHGGLPLVLGEHVLVALSNPPMIVAQWTRPARFMAELDPGVPARIAVAHDSALSIVSGGDWSQIEVVELGFRPVGLIMARNSVWIADGDAATGRIVLRDLETGEHRVVHLGSQTLLGISHLWWSATLRAFTTDSVHAFSMQEPPLRHARSHAVKVNGPARGWHNGHTLILSNGVAVGSSGPVRMRTADGDALARVLHTAFSHLVGVRDRPGAVPELMLYDGNDEGLVTATEMPQIAWQDERINVEPRFVVDSPSPACSSPIGIVGRARDGSLDGDWVYMQFTC